MFDSLIVVFLLLQRRKKIYPCHEAIGDLKKTQKSGQTEGRVQVGTKFGNADSLVLTY